MFSGTREIKGNQYVTDRPSPMIILSLNTPLVGSDTKIIKLFDIK